MLSRDFSPPPEPTHDEQHDALTKGLGRAVLWARSGRLDPELLRAACLTDTRYDHQVEDSRGDWLWDLVRTAGLVDQLRAPILAALGTFEDKTSAAQLCELAFHYAKAGDMVFRTRLYEINERTPIPDYSSLGLPEIVALDGEAGFLAVARVRGARLAAGAKWDWDESGMILDAEERFGAERVAALLAGSNDDRIRLFAHAWKADAKAQAAPEEQPSQRDRMRSIPLAQILATAGTIDWKFGTFYGWGKHADAADIDAVFARLLEPRLDPKVIADLLVVFMGRPFPRFDERLIAFCRHSEPELRRRAFIALGKMQHPAVREFAWTQLEDPLGGFRAVELLIQNYERGDEDRILELLELPIDEAELHSLFMRATELLEANPASNPARLGLVCYALTPCSQCRSRAVDVLVKNGAAPAWLIAECRYDVSEHIRKAADAFDAATNRNRTRSKEPNHDEEDGDYPPQAGL